MEEIIKILTGIRPEFDFYQESNFIENGVLDSFDMVVLVSTLEERYGIKICGTDIIPENFSDTDSIRRLVERYGGNV
ncbi:MAG: acyl carrier protein [Firmicutes bacterium]|nr:acyl carrier protein [Bacillota bacterium]